MQDLKKCKILLAEDNRINQRIASLTFNMMGVSIDIASNGQEALEMYRQNMYDLIMMDLHMPVMDGMEASRLIRSFEKETNSSHRVFMIALSASSVSELKDECIANGMDDFMEKPFKESELRNILARKFS
ncbi:MAG TPA: response regulator [Prolixibacteraceae bacterium]|nr:response regulator [Prolixibacteraceae bacterium]